VVDRRDVIALGGTTRGRHALVVRPANSARFFDMKVREVIASVGLLRGGKVEKVRRWEVRTTGEIVGDADVPSFSPS
jgi:hypothetical protein